VQKLKTRNLSYTNFLFHEGHEGTLRTKAWCPFVPFVDNSIKASA
jgi:hypothetical protein